MIRPMVDGNYKFGYVKQKISGYLQSARWHALHPFTLHPVFKFDNVR